MLKLTRKSLDELAQRMPVLSEKVQSSFIGGGNGLKKDPYTMSEYRAMGYAFEYGWVLLDGKFTPEFMTENYYEYYYDFMSDASGSHYWDNSGSYSGNSGGLEIVITPNKGIPFENSGSYGISGSYNNKNRSSSTYLANSISDLENHLPPELRMRLDGKIAISYKSNLGEPGRYNVGGIITLGILSLDALLGECVHAIQDFYDYGGDNHAAKEFQEHVIRDIYAMLYNCEISSRTVPLSYSSRFCDWLESCTDKNRGVDMHKFNQGISRYLSDFQKSHSKTERYQGQVPSDYDYNWEEMFYLMGIPMY